MRSGQFDIGRAGRASEAVFSVRAHAALAIPSGSFDGMVGSHFHQWVLIATAIGLFAAIPAVIAYNRFAARGEMLIGRYYTFADEFQAILHRKVHTSED